MADNDGYVKINVTEAFTRDFIVNEGLIMMNQGSVIGLLLLIILIGFYEACEEALQITHPTILKAKIAGSEDDKLKILSNRHGLYLHTIRYWKVILFISYGILSYILANDLANKWWNFIFIEILFTLLVIVLAVVTPRLWARNQPPAFLLGAVPLLNFSILLLFPVRLIALNYRRILNPLIPENNETMLEEEDLIFLADLAYDKGILENEERHLIQAAIEFDDIEVSNILTPRVDIVGLDIHATESEVRQLFQQTEFSRLVVYNENLDDIIGILHVKDFNRYLRAKDQTSFPLNTVATLMTEPLFVPPTVMLSELLHMMQIRRIHMVVVVDEHGGTIGITTMEDLLEELVGEIWDETDVVEKEFRVIDGQLYSVSGRFELFKLFEILGLEGEDDWISNTVNGFVIEQLDRVPEEGETFCYENYGFEVVEMGDHHVQRVLVSPLLVDGD